MNGLRSLLLAALAVAAIPAAALGFERDLSGADIVLIGEVHGSPAHHANQARLVRDLAARAVVFEMLEPAQAARALPGLRADRAALDDAIGWSAGPWPDFALYYPIFAAAGAAPVYGAARPRAEVRRAIGEGAAAVFGAGADAFGIDRPLDQETQAAREALQAEAHCNALPETLLPGMVEAQRLRDADLAAAALAAHARNGGPVVVIAGNGHVRSDWGVPALLAMAAPGLKVVAIGQGTGAGGQPFDGWLEAESVLPEDPCAAFR